MLKINEPLDVAPFLEWAARREHVLEVEYSDKSREGEGGLERLLEEIGWDDPSGRKRMYRWRHENKGGRVERAFVENALHRAGYLFEDVYPDLGSMPELPTGPSTRLMTDEQVVAAHTVYVKAKLTQVSLAELIWERYGYASASSCAKALVDAFRSLGLPARRCTSTTAEGKKCNGNPLAGEDCCYRHKPEWADKRRESALRRELRIWTIPDELLLEARVMREDWGMSWRGLGRALLDRTPFTSIDHLSKRLKCELAQLEEARPVLVYMPATSAWERAA